MDIEWHSEAKKEFLQLPEEVQEEIGTYLDKLQEEGLQMKETGLVHRNQPDLSFYKLKIMSEDEAINHRVAFDPRGTSFVIYKVDSRNDFYRRENLEEVKDRM
ncbi:MAG: type II toxin-antitoxin system RelE/ParE family toxin [Candidatus Nanohalobium sp.]